MSDAVRLVAERILDLHQPDAHFVVGIDGVDGAGKTTFADALAQRLHAVSSDLRVQVVHLDDFHHPKEIRYRQGRHSPRGFFEDSYDLAAFHNRVIGPLAMSDGRGTGIVVSSLDLELDIPTSPDPIPIGPATIVVVEGIFLHRDELAGVFDFTIFLEVPFQVSVQRMHSRDGSAAYPNDPSVRRYVDGQKLYLDRCAPKQRADVIVNNAEEC